CAVEGVAGRISTLRHAIPPRSPATLPPVPISESPAMNLPRWCLAALTALSLAACTTAPPRPVTPQTDVATAVPAHDNLNATIWMQASAEYEATVRGIYAAAQRSLDAALDDPAWNALPQGEFQAGFENKPPAIVVDADETMI